MQHTIRFDEVHIALDENLVDTFNVGDAIEIKEYAVNYIISEADMDVLDERHPTCVIFLELHRSAKPQREYEATGLRIYSL